ncbi:PREDICTED: pre-mRNA-splicing factor 18-like [Amphimedon queenslandica]|uniref:Pre-mRNA-splicing factor 18 n=1 Tax=Amphimedon queenslandica TaxID=400682 RepID=A0A1X7VRT6_AMPQE|nr:PREDICTED: pre-mRNA-splicing factor 18-like [Amphimedon queenslandica]|eukprot:XP_003383037.1 PREDICTED: pre-mRNA-splicing factor 18-like [Amphimedon queenslandica]
MDALKILREEQKRKREELAEKNVTKGKKYFRRGELERISIKPDEEEKTGPVHGASPTTPTGSGSLFSPTAIDGGATIFNLPRHEVIRRLRERNEPIRLFGETDNEASLRLRQIEILAPENVKGLRNDFKDALDRLDQEELDLLAKQGEVDLKIRGKTRTFEDIAEMAKSLGKEETDKDNEIVLEVLTFLLDDWGRELNVRDINGKLSTQGKLVSATHRQTEAYLEPLFKSLRKKNISIDILKHLSNICLFVTQREYVKANSVYLDMSIGNAPWPIGVTMVGIHARTGREKIFSQSIAHVLNDETQRKYIQAVKRLMTFCQNKYPTDPSKSVEYGSKPMTQ